MSEAIEAKPTNKPSQELRELLDRTFKEKPDKKDLGDLRQYMTAHPGLVSAAVNLALSVQGKIVDKVATQPALRMAIDDELATLRAGLNYDRSPTLERLLIGNIENCYLRLQWVEYALADSMNKDGSYSSVQHWEKRLTATQARFLRAVETLARVRKLTSPVVQFNIAQEGGQQVNVAGDLIKPDKT